MGDSYENSDFILFYKHVNDEKWQDVVLKNVCKNDNSGEYRVKYTVSNAQPGRYICQIQSKSDFDMSEKSGECFVYKEEEVSSLFLFSRTFMKYLNLLLSKFYILLSEAKLITLKTSLVYISN